MKLIEMILLSDTIKALNNGYFTVSYRLFLNTVFVISSLSMKGCRKSESTDAIIRDGFNRSHAVNCDGPTAGGGGAQSATGDAYRDRA